MLTLLLLCSAGALFCLLLQSATGTGKKPLSSTQLANCLDTPQTPLGTAEQPPAWLWAHCQQELCWPLWGNHVSSKPPSGGCIHKV